MRRIPLAAGAAVTAAALALAPVASAQTTVVDLVPLVNGEVETADCGALGTVLTGLNLVDEDTTRAELVTDINALIGDDIALKLMLGTSVNAVADRALECEIVQEDPQEDFLTSLLNSSNGTSSADVFLPLLGEPALAELSSTL